LFGRLNKWYYIPLNKHLSLVILLFTISCSWGLPHASQTSIKICLWFREWNKADILDSFWILGIWITCPPTAYFNNFS
jgi:hypothetical protein